MNSQTSDAITWSALVLLVPPIVLLGLRWTLEPKLRMVTPDHLRALTVEQKALRSLDSSGEIILRRFSWRAFSESLMWSAIGFDFAQLNAGLASGVSKPSPSLNYTLVPALLLWHIICIVYMLTAHRRVETKIVAWALEIKSSNSSGEELAQKQRYFGLYNTFSKVASFMVGLICSFGAVFFWFYISLR